MAFDIEQYGNVQCHSIPGCHSTDKFSRITKKLFKKISISHRFFENKCKNFVYCTLFTRLRRDRIKTLINESFSCYTWLSADVRAICRNFLVSACRLLLWSTDSRDMKKKVPISSTRPALSLESSENALLYSFVPYGEFISKLNTFIR